MIESRRDGLKLDQTKFAENPEAYLRELDSDGRLAKLFPALEAAKGVGQSPIKHAEGDVFVHTLITLKKLDEQTPSDQVFGPITDPHDRLLIIYALMYHDVGKKERNEAKLLEERVDHVQVSMQHAQRDLADKLSEADLKIVLELIGKHEHIAEARHTSTKINKLHGLFAIDGDLNKGRIQLKFAECDLFGRLRGGDAGNQEQMLRADDALAQRNIGIYQLLLEQEAAGATFPINKVTTEVRTRIERLIASAQLD